MMDKKLKHSGTHTLPPPPLEPLPHNPSASAPRPAFFAYQRRQHHPLLLKTTTFLLTRPSSSATAQAPASNPPSRSHPALTPAPTSPPSTSFAIITTAGAQHTHRNWHPSSTLPTSNLPSSPQLPPSTAPPFLSPTSPASHRMLATMIIPHNHQQTQPWTAALLPHNHHHHPQRLRCQRQVSIETTIPPLPYAPSLTSPPSNMFCALLQPSPPPSPSSPTTTHKLPTQLQRKKNDVLRKNETLLGCGLSILGCVDTTIRLSPNTFWAITSLLPI